MEDELEAILAEYGNFDLPDNFDSVFSCFDPVPGSITSVGPSQYPEPIAQLTISTSSSSRFAPLKSDAEVEQAKASAVPSNTRKNTSWSVNIWKEWSQHRRQTCSSITEWPVHLFIAQPQELNHWLSKFVLETRKANGEPYPPDTLYGICSGLLRYIRERRPEINIFKDAQFAGFQRTLDAEMKRLRSMGLGVRKKQAEPISIQEEDLLWEKGCLGDQDPHTLLDTMLFLCGLHFALRSGEEHRSLRTSHFEIKQDKNGSECLVYTENTSKNNQ
jgi:hypothetical protein